MKKGKKGMRQNHSRSAEATKEQIRKLTLETDMSARQICDELQLGYSTVMKYRKEILLEEERKLKKEQEEKARKEKSNKKTIIFRVKDKFFEVDTIEKNGNTLYSLDNIKEGMKEISNIDIEEYVRKTNENGEDFIFGSYLVPIANIIKDFYFTKSVQRAVFKPTEEERYLAVTNSIKYLADFIKLSSDDDKEDIDKLQNELLKKLDEATEIQELASITSKIKKARAKRRDIEKEDKLRDYILLIMKDKDFDMAKFSDDIKNENY